MRHFLFLIIVAAVLLVPVIDVATLTARQPDAALSVMIEANGPQETWLDGRRLLWQQPTASPPTDGYPVIFVLHGAVQRADAWFGGSDPWSMAQTSFTTTALERGLIVVAPESRRPLFWGPRSWDAFAATVDTSLDLPFFQDIFAWLETLPVNSSAVYCTGFSSGGFMTSRLARTFPACFAAVAIHSGADATATRLTWMGPILDCTKPLHFPAGYPPTMVIHGRYDEVVPALCGINLYGELQRNGIPSQLVLTEDGHVWQTARNQEILDWLTGA
ncbi:MAG: prolyl oligopeptidase family serine peptidase [Candidatus Thermoplasmatota archaeon]|nr:prolyl oligopeptidase family serine peptidase [Candidatus Thermoplasmatota archaeon]